MPRFIVDMTPPEGAELKDFDFDEEEYLEASEEFLIGAFEELGIKAEVIRYE